MAIESGDTRLPPSVGGSIQQSRRWVHISQVNCDQYVFGDFLEIILLDLENNPVSGTSDNGIRLLWDNLSLHKIAYLTHIIEGHPSFNRFISVDRQTYRPEIAPIEYMFCDVAAELSRRVKRGWNTQMMRNKLFDICSSIGPEVKFYSTFLHCAYPF